MLSELNELIDMSDYYRVNPRKGLFLRWWCVLPEAESLKCSARGREVGPEQIISQNQERGHPERGDG